MTMSGMIIMLCDIVIMLGVLSSYHYHCDNINLWKCCVCLSMCIRVDPFS